MKNQKPFQKKRLLMGPTAGSLPESATRGVSQAQQANREQRDHSGFRNGIAGWLSRFAALEYGSTATSDYHCARERAGLAEDRSGDESAQAAEITGEPGVPRRRVAD